MASSALSRPVRIQALARASAIIDVIATGDEAGVGLTAIGRATSLNKTTAFNLLASLAALGFVEKDAHTRKYRLGLRCLELGRQVQQRLQVSHVARPVLVDLCRKTNETVNLGIPGMLDFRVIDSFVGSRVSHGRANDDWRWMYHCTALGKAFLTGWDSLMRQSIYDSCELTGLTPNTITDPYTLEAQLAGFRERGYATDLEEYEIGVNGLASWVVDGLGEVAAAISVSGHSSRLTETVMHRIAPDVVRAANAVSTALGGGEPHRSPSGTRPG
ncbi:MAG: IclR family transcriptional regulator [Gammaproteobacteria bacterium]|nr:IclR family transcriptional regulator [Gammaproteobacteria bacterium]MDE0366175.1 IclR family transcriptional regulator [Gammaproteobacteria bacterium]